MNADVVCFQEIFEEDALRHVVTETDLRGIALNGGRARQVQKLSPQGDLPQTRRIRPIPTPPLPSRPMPMTANRASAAPVWRSCRGLVLSGKPKVIQVLRTPVEIPFQDLTGEDAGFYRLRRLSRPILKVRVPVGGHVVTIFNCHLKSKLGEFSPRARRALCARGEPARL